MAELAERELNEGVQNQETYIKDTTDFIRKINEIEMPLPVGSQLFTMDVKSLYPSVPRKEGMEACKISLDNRSNGKIPTSNVMEMIQLILDNNIFQFNGKQYIQKEGTAIHD